MARNGSGTYSLPEDAFVFDTVISHTTVNSNFSDIAAEITNSVDRDGQSSITGILQHSVTVNQTAHTGSVQGNNPITTEFYEISVCANPGDAVTLPNAVAGQLVIVVNNGANSADIFPYSGDKIDGGSANAAFALASGANALFICQDGTDWDSLGGGFFTPSSTTTMTNKTLTAPVLNDPTFDVAVGVTAHTGSAQGNGAITSTFVEISVCGTAGDAVTLPTAAAGKLVIIANNGAESADVFPASGDAIDGASANAAQALAAGSNRIYICQDATDWDTIGGAGTELSSDTSPQLGGFLDANGNYIQMQKGGDISSASPTVIDTDGDYFICTGTTSFSAFTVAADRHFFLEFSGALTITHGSGTIDLPGGANITTVASDVGEFVSTAANVVTCVNYTRADGGPVLIVNNSVDETKIKDAFVGDFTEVVAATGDSLLFGDASDSGATKRDTLQGVVDLVYKLDATPDTDHTANGPQTNTLNAGYGTAAMDLVYLNANGKWLEADADAAGTSINLLGIALEAKTDGQAMLVALSGSFVRDDTWNWTIGVPLYVSGDLGAITATKPSGSADIVRTVGYALTADVIYFNPSSDYVTLA